MPAHIPLPDIVRPVLALTGAAWCPGPGFVGADLDGARARQRQPRRPHIARTPA